MGWSPDPTGPGNDPDQIPPDDGFRAGPSLPARAIAAPLPRRPCGSPAPPQSRQPPGGQLFTGPDRPSGERTRILSQLLHDIQHTIPALFPEVQESASDEQNHPASSRIGGGTPTAACGGDDSGQSSEGGTTEIRVLIPAESPIEYPTGSQRPRAISPRRDSRPPTSTPGVAARSSSSWSPGTVMSA